MLNPLNKRFKRDLKSDFGKYVAIFLFLVFSCYNGTCHFYLLHFHNK